MRGLAMGIRSDVAGIESKHLRDMLAVEGARILEIGCGNGRLTRQYADAATQVVGIDVTTAALEGVRDAVEAASADFAAASATRLPFRCGSFDHALFAWSL